MLLFFGILHVIKNANSTKTKCLPDGGNWNILDSVSLSKWFGEFSADPGGVSIDRCGRQDTYDTQWIPIRHKFQYNYD